MRWKKDKIEWKHCHEKYFGDSIISICFLLPAVSDWFILLLIECDGGKFAPENDDADSSQIFPLMLE